MKTKWALISVYNKTGIIDIAERLIKMGWSIISSGGTAKALTKEKIPVKDVAELVGGEAILGHRVVTLSREVHAGLLADPNKLEDMAELENLGIPFIDMVICDFYPLHNAIVQENATIESVIEKTDIGGPTMVRSAAKGGRIVVCTPWDREVALQELEKTGDVSSATRQQLRARAEFEVAKYVLESARFHSHSGFDGIMGERVDIIPKGENGPQSPAGVYFTEETEILGPRYFHVIEGQPLSYNNWTDINRLLQTMTHVGAAWRQLGWEKPFIAVVVKHGNPCGGAVGETPGQAIEKAAQGDSLAAFGGSVMTNFHIDARLAEKLVTSGMKDNAVQKFDTVIAPGFEAGVKEILERKKGKCRLVVNSNLERCWSDLDQNMRFRFMTGGFLTEPNYTFVLDLGKAKMYGGDIRTGWNIAFEEDLLLAWAICATSNSNTITIVKNRMLIGNGVGQQARVWAAKLAVMRAKDAMHADLLEGSVACSDSFFPFPDAVQILIDAGVKAIFSTSGSIGDQAVQELCVKNGIALFQLPDSEARGFFGH
jgi:phosphoribosylaminoimidazolecarboxamide formyltransferase / IMP cyclohydrolase